MGRIRQIRTRDGSLLPFRQRQVADTILLALKEGGEEDRGLADELAGVVALFLEKYHPEDVPSLDDVDDMLARVLEETGHARAAAALLRMNRDRDRLQEELSVRAAGEQGTVAPWERASPVTPWNPTRLTKSLVERRELPLGLAEEIVAAVETHLTHLDFGSVSSALLRDLVAEELFERGLEGSVDRDPLEGLPASELMRTVEEERARPVAEAVAAPLLERYARGRLFGEIAISAHDSGRIHVYGMSSPLKLERAVVPASLLDVADERPLAEVLLGLRRRLEGLRLQVRGSLELPDLVAALSRRADVARDARHAARLLIETLDFRDVHGSLRGPAHHLCLPLGLPEGGAAGESCVTFVEALLDLLADRSTLADGLAVSLAWPAEEIGDPPRILLEKGLALAVDRPETWVRLLREADVPVSDQPAKPLPSLRLSLGRIALNLPLVLMDLQGADLKEVMGQLDRAVAGVVEAFHEQFWFQRQGRPEGLHGLVVGLGGPARVDVRADCQEVDLELWGLTYGLELLVQRGVIARSQMAEAAAKILGYLDYHLGGERQGVSLRLRLGGTRDLAVRRRFFDAALGWASRFEVRDLRELLQEDRADPGILPVAVPLLSPRNGALLQGPFAERLGPGFAIPLSAFDQADPVEGLHRLRRETRLGWLSLAPRRPGEDLFEVQEELFD